MIRWTHDERGQVAGVEMLFLGTLILFAGTLLIVNVWTVIDTKLAVTAASREAARVLAEEAGRSGAITSARTAAVVAMSGHGRDLDADEIEIDHTQGLGRCDRFTVTVTHTIDAIRLGPFGGLGTQTVRSSHSEIVDPYRSGLTGSGDCRVG